MLDTYFNHWRHGRLQRLKFLLFAAGLGPIFFGLILLLLGFTGLTEQGLSALTHLSIPNIQKAIASYLGPIIPTVFLLFYFGFVFAFVNICAKRLRDITGYAVIPGLVILMCSLFLHNVLPGQEFHNLPVWFDTIIFCLLAILPSGFISVNKPPVGARNV